MAINENENLRKNYNQIVETLPDNVELVAVSKTHNHSKIQEVYNFGQRVFAENKVQDLVEKHPLLPNDIRWHMIGHLQSNKVKYIAPIVDTIQSVDSRKILQEIDKQAAKHQRKINVLLQLKISEEETKYGLETDEAEELFNEYLSGQFPNVEITGLMGMASFTEDINQIRKEFTLLKQFFDKLSLSKKLSTLSMGMSSDFQTAIECGANSVRIGSAIFGDRDYSI